MIIQPKIRGFICTTAHPIGCEHNVQQQIRYIKSKPAFNNGPKKVLVIGASTGYGLASRIAAAFGSHAATVGVFFEKESDGRRTASAGWYSSVAFEKAAKKEGLYAKSFNGDAFSDEMKQKVISTIKNNLGQVDLVIYSLASPRRTHPKTGKVYKSVLKPNDKPYTNKSFDFGLNKLESVTIQPSTKEDVAQTVGVMGGEDWAMWIDALEKEGCLADGAITIAYSYMGPKLTMDIYRNGTIGAAKDHLEATAKDLDAKLKEKGGRALVSVNKALVTQSSSAIPFIPLYFTILTKVMKEKGVDEDCIGQIHRLFADRIYAGNEIPVDKEGRVRIDEFELRSDIQEEVNKRWEAISEENIREIADIEGYNADFLKLFGFGINGVDYSADVDPVIKFED